VCLSETNNGIERKKKKAEGEEEEEEETKCYVCQ
jgi:hypothetical protein